jgi:hypothetical protein
VRDGGDAPRVSATPPELDGDAIGAKHGHHVGEAPVRSRRVREAKPLPGEQRADDEVGQQIGVRQVLGEDRRDHASRPRRARSQGAVEENPAT